MILRLCLYISIELEEPIFIILKISVDLDLDVAQLRTICLGFYIPYNYETTMTVLLCTSLMVDSEGWASSCVSITIEGIRADDLQSIFERKFSNLRLKEVLTFRDQGDGDGGRLSLLAFSTQGHKAPAYSMYGCFLVILRLSHLK